MYPTREVTITILSSNHENKLLPLVALKKPVDHNIDHLFDILEQFAEEADPLSLQLHRLAADYIRQENKIQSEQQVSPLRELLVNPLDAQNLLVMDVMLDEDGWLWERKVLDEYLKLVQDLDLECLSPFTSNPLKSQPHPFASAMSHWLIGSQSRQAEQTGPIIESEGRELMQPKGRFDEETLKTLKLKLSLFQTSAKKAVFRKKFKNSQQALSNTIAKTNNNSGEMYNLINKFAEEVRQKEQLRTELEKQQMEMLTKISESATALVKSQLGDTQEALNIAVKEQNQLKQTVIELEEQREQDRADQEKYNVESEAKVEKRLQNIEQLSQAAFEINDSKIKDVKQHVNHLEKHAELQDQQITKQDEMLKEYEVQLGQIRAKNANLEHEKDLLQGKVKRLQSRVIF